MATVLCAVVLLLSPLAGNREAGELALRMEARYRGAKTLQATFLERYAENGSVVRTEAGTAYFRGREKCVGSTSVRKKICSWWTERPHGFMFPRITPSPACPPSKAAICARRWRFWPGR